MILMPTLTTQIYSIHHSNNIVS